MDSKPQADMDTDHVEHVRRLSLPEEAMAKEWATLAENAHQATAEEHSMGFLTAIKRYPKACFWSMAVSLIIIMDGYDTALIGSLFGFPAFQKRFGHEVHHTGKYQLDAQWQVALGLATNIGNIVGVTMNGILTERFGHKKTVLGSLVLLTGFIFIVFFAQNIQTLFLGEILCGLPWGVFTTLAPAYASEVTPVVLRGHLETFVVCCWGIGQFISYAVLFSLNTSKSSWSYRIPFAVQWMWPVIIIPLLTFAPESPWWLVRKGRIEEAEKSVRRLTTTDRDVAHATAKNAVALMVETNRLEKDIDAGTSYKDCFTGTDLWRTEISCCAWAIQVLSGYVIQGYATYFFEQAGLSANNAFKMTLGQGGLHLLFNIISVFFTGTFGRRRVYFWGLAVMTCLMFLIGILALPHQTTAFGYAQSAIYLLWFCGYCLTLGPLAYIIVGEASSTRLRSKSIALARTSYLILSITNAVVAPYILNPTKGNWKGKAGFLTGGVSAVGLVWVYFRLPETGGRTYEELDVLFAEPNINARNFNDHMVEIRNNEVVVKRKTAHRDVESE